MFTSRAEHRLLLRCDNADLRLCDFGRRVGLLSTSQYDRFSRYREQVLGEIDRLKTTQVRPRELDAERLVQLGMLGLEQAAPIAKLLTRPGATYQQLLELNLGRPELEPRAQQQVEIAILYEGYIRRQQREVERQESMERHRLPPTLDYCAVHGLTNEARDKLVEISPLTVGQASRIPGVNPADITVLLIHIKKAEFAARQGGARAPAESPGD